MEQGDSAAENVARGAERFDMIIPGWARRIDRDRLDMASGYNCIVAQLWGGVYVDHQVEVAKLLAPERFTAEVGWHREHEFTTAIVMPNHGLVPPPTVQLVWVAYKSYCNRLEEAWLEQIEKRL